MAQSGNILFEINRLKKQILGENKKHFHMINTVLTRCNQSLDFLLDQRREFFVRKRENESWVPSIRELK